MCLAECWDKANSMQKSLRIFAWINILRKKIRLGPPLTSQYSRLGSLSGGQFLCAYSLPLPCWWSVNFWSSEDTTGERSALFLSRVMKILCYLIPIFTYSNSLLSSSVWCLLYPPISETHSLKTSKDARTKSALQEPANIKSHRLLRNHLWAVILS